MRDLVRPTLIMMRGFYRKGNVTWFVNSYVPVWGVICHLKLTLSVSFFHFVKTSKFPWDLVHKKKEIRFSPLSSRRMNVMCMLKNLSVYAAGGDHVPIHFLNDPISGTCIRKVLKHRIRCSFLVLYKQIHCNKLDAM